MRAIPTTYAGIRFRSRLEARYAVLFDLLGWRWSYEPIDLAGWIPDFVIHGARPILVEVKPIFTFDGVLGARIRKAADLHDDATRPGYEALICGADLSDMRQHSLRHLGDYGLGWLWDHWWDPAAVFYLSGSDRVGLCHCDADYRDRISGIYEGNGHIGQAVELKRLWDAAGNEVQWRKDD